MRCLVTGGTGFVGAYVVRELVNAGHQVTVLDLLPNREFLADVFGGSVPDSVEVVVVSGDVSDLPQLLRTMGAGKTERVVHLVFTLVLSSEANPLRALKVNCERTLNAFEAALALGLAGAGNGRWLYVEGTARAVATALKAARCSPGLAA